MQAYPKFQLECALRLRAGQRQIASSELPELIEATSLLNNFKVGVDLAGFLFSVVVMRIRSSEGMLSMIEALDALCEIDRNSFIDAAALALDQSAGSFVHSGWAQEQLADIDLRPALKRFRRMKDIAEHWGRHDFQIQLVCAQSVILDEGLNDTEAAIIVVDSAIAELGNVAAFVRQKAKVLSHAGDSASSAQLLISVEDVISVGEPFDRALALRDGAVSAAQAGLFPDAIRLFEKAYAVLSSKGNHPALAVGVRIDIALTYWAAKRSRESLIAIADALDDVELLDPIASLQNERAHQYARAVIGVIWSDLDPYPSQDSRRIAIGQPSVLAGAGPLLKVDLKPLADNWRILALCEIEMGVDAGIEGRSQIKQTCPGLGSIELLIATARYARMVAKGEIELGFRYGLAAASAKRVFAELKASGVAEVRVTPAELVSKSLQTLLDEGWEEAVWTVPLDLLVWRRFRGGWDSQFVAQTDAACLATWGSSTAIQDILAAAAGDQARSDVSAATALAFRLNPAFEPQDDPAMRFVRDQLLVCHTATSSARRILEPIIVPELVEGWVRVLADEGFALRAPMQYAPLIKAEIDRARATGLAGTARLLLAAAPAVRVQLGEKWIAFLRTIGGS